MTKSPVAKADLGDGVERDFFLGSDELRQIKRLCGRGFYSLYMNYTVDADPDEVYEVVRLGLIGGGLPPKDAKELCDYYARPPRPLREVYLLAYKVLNASWNGAEEVKNNASSRPMTAEQMDNFFEDLEGALVKQGKPTDWIKGKSFAEIQAALAVQARKNPSAGPAPDADTFNAIKNTMKAH